MIIATSRVSKKGLTSIPAAVRRSLRIEEGDILIWEVREGGEVVVRVEKDPYRVLRGKYRDEGLTYDKVEEIADLLLEGEVSACDRARHANSTC
mgnify:CR=1 FL=1